MFILLSKRIIKKVAFASLLILAVYLWQAHAVKAQPEAIYFVEGRKNEISLTFNVFPGENNASIIKELLHVLGKKEVHATFFCQENG